MEWGMYSIQGIQTFSDLHPVSSLFLRPSPWCFQASQRWWQRSRRRPLGAARLNSRRGWPFRTAMRCFGAAKGCVEGFRLDEIGQKQSDSTIWPNLLFHLWYWSISSGERRSSDRLHSKLVQAARSKFCCLKAIRSHLNQELQQSGCPTIWGLRFH